MSGIVHQSQVGYRTNGLSFTVQVHHLLRPVGQTAGIGIPRFKPRDPEGPGIADSHSAVTMSHSGPIGHSGPPRPTSNEVSPKTAPARPTTSGLSFSSYTNHSLAYAPCCESSPGSLRDWESHNSNRQVERLSDRGAREHERVTTVTPKLHEMRTLAQLACSSARTACQRSVILA